MPKRVMSATIPCGHRERLAVGRASRPTSSRASCPCSASTPPKVEMRCRRSARLCVGWSRSHCRFTTAGRCSSTPFVRALAERVAHLGHVLVALAEEHVVADADDLGEEGDHRRRLAHRLAVRDLRGGLVQFLGHQAEQVAARPERVARARGLVAEDRDAEAGVEDARRDARRARGPRGSPRPAGHARIVASLYCQVSRKSLSCSPVSRRRVGRA